MIEGSTLIGHHRGEIECDAEVLDVRRTPAGWEIITDRTAFYPRNPRWPDQPADLGTVLIDGESYPVVDVERRDVPTGGLDAMAGAESTPDGGEDRTFACVVHVVDTGDAGDAGPSVGDRVRWRVDEQTRRAVSRQHTAVHVMALALNRATAPCWTKVAPRLDSLGNPDVDSLAVDSSTLTPEGGVDVYRLGKSLRKKGFDKSLLPDPAHLATALQAAVAEWVATDGRVRVAADDDRLESRRLWQAELPEGTAEIPCGGSHATSLRDLGTVTFGIDYDDASITIRTAASGPPVGD